MPEYEPRGITVKDVKASDFIEAYAKHLKDSGKMELPKYVDVIKTAVRKELAPYDPDWYYVRSAAVARRVYMHKGIGVAGIARGFGGKHRRGTCTNRFGRSARGVIRHALQQLEEMKVVSQDKSGGRMMTSTGQQELDRIACQIIRGGDKAE